MSGLNYSQKRLLSRPLSSRRNDPRTRQLRVYAVLTGFMSLLISIATLILYIVK